MSQQISNILKLTDVIRKTSLSSTTIYRRMGEGTFPKSIPLGGRRVGWWEHEIDDWIITIHQTSSES